MHSIGADAATADAGIRYLTWFLPGLALQYVSVVMISALRGTGVVLPAIWLATLPGLQLDHFWYLSVASGALQAIISLVLLHRVMRERLN